MNSWIFILFYVFSGNTFISASSGFGHCLLIQVDPVPFLHDPFFPKPFLIFWCYKVFQGLWLSPQDLYIFLVLTLTLTSVVRNLILFIRERSLETNIWARCVLIATRLSLLLGFFSGQNYYVCVTYVYNMNEVFASCPNLTHSLNVRFSLSHEINLTLQAREIFYFSERVSQICITNSFFPWVCQFASLHYSWCKYIELNGKCYKRRTYF